MPACMWLYLCFLHLEISHGPRAKIQAKNRLRRIETRGEQFADINNYILVTLIDVNEDIRLETKVLSYSICHLCIHND